MLVQLFRISGPNANQIRILFSKSSCSSLVSKQATVFRNSCSDAVKICVLLKAFFGCLNSIKNRTSRLQKILGSIEKVWVSKYLNPNRPFSSPVCHLKSLGISASRSASGSHLSLLRFIDTSCACTCLYIIVVSKGYLYPD